MSLIFRDSIGYLIAMYSSRLLSFICKIIIARLLGPGDYGLWSMLALILLYGNFLDLGLVYALVKQVPFYRGKGQIQEINVIRSTIFASITLISTIVGIAILTFYSIYFGKYGNNLSLTISLLSLVLILQQAKNYFLSYFVAEKNFQAVSLLIICLAFLNAILTISLVIKFSLVGLPLGLAFGYFLVLLYIFYKYRPTFKFYIDTKKLLTLLKIGFPIMLIAINYAIFFTIDRVLIFKYMGKENLGYYGIASALNGLLILFPASLGVMIFPRLSEKFGAEGEAKNLKESIYMPTIMLSYFMPILLGIIYLLLPTAVKIFIPQYLPGVNAGKIALMGIMFLSTSLFAQKFLIVINKQVHCLFIILFALLLKIVIIYIFITRQMGIEGVALAANIVYFVFSAFIIMYASYYYKNNLLESVKYLIKIYLPFVYLLLIFIGFGYFKSIPILNIGNDVRHIYIDFITLVILVLVPFGYFIKKNLSTYLSLNIHQNKN